MKKSFKILCHARNSWVEPIDINSSLVSAQKSKRLLLIYLEWTATR